MGLLGGIEKTIEAPFKAVGGMATSLEHGDIGGFLKNAVSGASSVFKMDNPLGLAATVGMNSLS